MWYANQIFALREVLEYRFKNQQPIIICFIDFAAVTNSIDRAKL